MQIISSIAYWFAAKRVHYATDPGQQLRRAIVLGDQQKIEELLSYPGAQNAVRARSKHGNTALHRAAMVGNPALVRKLIDPTADLKADVNAVNDDLITPLHEAVLRGHTEVVRILLEEGGASLQRYEQKGKDPIALAEHYERYEILKILKAYKASLEEGLRYAAHSGFLELGFTGLVDEWIYRGADINAPDDRTGNSALHCAIQGQWTKTMEYLLRKGADINQKNIDGITPSDLVQSSNNSKIRKTFEDTMNKRLQPVARFLLQRIFT